MIRSKKQIMYGIQGKEIKLKADSVLWECYHQYTGKFGYAYIQYLYRSCERIIPYTPFITEKQAEQLGII